MSRYIDADILRKNEIARCHCVPSVGSNDNNYKDLDEVLADAPTADVVEVVRCKDCAHYHEMEGFDYKGRKAHHCVWHSALRGENDYCSDGIRREKCEIG